MKNTKEIFFDDISYIRYFLINFFKKIESIIPIIFKLNNIIEVYLIEINFFINKLKNLPLGYNKTDKFKEYLSFLKKN